MKMRFRSVISGLCLLCLLLAQAVQASIVHVPDEAPTIQAGCDMAQEGDTVLVAPGVYAENVVLTNRSLTIASDYILIHDPDVIDSTRINPRALGSIFQLTGCIDVSFTGFTFLNGQQDPDNGLGGVLRADTSSISVSHCNFFDNQAVRGGGIFCDESELKIDSCYFSNNIGSYRGGAICARYSQVEIINSTFSNNMGFNLGGAISLSFSSGRFEENVFVDNQCPYAGASNGGGALGCGTNDTPASIEIISNIFERNHARMGGAIKLVSIDTVRISDNILRCNWAEDPIDQAQGGAIDLGLECESAEVSGNEFYYNYAPNKSGALLVPSSAHIHDNLFYKNHTDIFGYAAATQIGNGNGDIVAEFTNNLFFGNYKTGDLLTSWSGCVQVDPTHTAVFHQSDFIGNVPYAAGQQAQHHGIIEVDRNYWGDPTGPYHETQNPGGLGDTVFVELNVLPFSTTPYTTRWLRAPEPLELMLPEEGEFLDEDSVVFLWHAAPDSTPHDTMRYTLELSDSPYFINIQLFYTDVETTVTVTDLNFDMDYYWRVRARDIYDLTTYSEETRSFMVVTVDEDEFTELPTEWSIERMYPNPFNMAMHVIIAAPNSETVRIAVFDLQGRLVETLQHGSLTAGHHRFIWRPEVATGMYFVRVSTESWQEIRKIVYLK